MKLAKDRLRELLCVAAQRQPLHGADIILLSGGYDSALVLAALREIGRLPSEALTLTCGEYETTDVQLAKIRARQFDIPHRVYSIPRTVPYITELVTDIISRCGCVLKTAVENSLLILSLVRSDLGKCTLWNGMEADDCWGTSRTMMKELSAKGALGFNTYRLSCLYAWSWFYPQSSTAVCRQICMTNDIKWADPFTDTAVAEFMCLAPYKLLHCGGLKNLGLLAFPEIASPKPQKMLLQVESGVRDFMEHEVCAGATSPVLWYNTLARSMGINPRGSRASWRSWLRFRDHRCDQLRAVAVRALQAKQILPFAPLDFPTIEEYEQTMFGAQP